MKKNFSKLHFDNFFGNSGARQAKKAHNLPIHMIHNIKLNSLKTISRTPPPVAHNPQNHLSTLNNISANKIRTRNPEVAHLTKYRPTRVKFLPKTFFLVGGKKAT